MQTQKTTTRLSINGIDVQVGHEFLASIVNSVPDVQENLKLFEALSSSQNQEVRWHISMKDTTSRKIVKTLLQYQEHKILVMLLSNSDTARLINEKEILKIIKEGTVVDVRLVASRLDNLERCDICKIATILSRHPDPSVRGEVASRWRWPNQVVPRKVLQRLANDHDADVAYAAKDSLAE